MCSEAGRAGGSGVWRGGCGAGGGEIGGEESLRFERKSPRAWRARAVSCERARAAGRSSALYSVATRGRAGRGCAAPRRAGRGHWSHRPVPGAGKGCAPQALDAPRASRTRREPGLLRRRPARARRGTGSRGGQRQRQRQRQRRSRALARRSCHDKVGPPVRVSAAGCAAPGTEVSTNASSLNRPPGGRVLFQFQCVSVRLGPKWKKDKLKKVEGLEIVCTRLFNTPSLPLSVPLSL